MSAPEIGVRIKLSGSDEFRQDLARVGEDARSSLSGATAATTTAASQTTQALGTVQGAVGGFLDLASGALGSIGRVVDGVANGFGTVLSKVTEIGGSFGVAAGLAGAGLGGLIYAARTYSQSVAEGVSATKEFADGLGLTTENFSRMQGAVRLGFGDGDALGGALTEMRKKIVQLAEGNQSAIDAFGGLNLRLKDFRDGPNGGLRSTRDALDLVLDRIKAVKVPTEQAALIMGVFGKTQKELGGFVTEGAEAFRKAEKDVEAYGTVLDKATAEKIDGVLTAQGKLGESLRGLGMSLTRVFFPFFAEASTDLSTWLNSSQKGIEEFLKRVKDTASSIKDDIKLLLGELFTSDTAASTKAAARRTFGAGVGSVTVGGGASSDDEEEDDEDKPASATKQGKAAGRIAEINGVLVDLDKERALNSELAANREAIVNGKRVSLLNDAAQASEASGRRIAVVNERQLDLDRGYLDAGQGNNRRFAEVNGQRIEIATKTASTAAGRAIQSAFRFPVIGSVAAGIRSIGSAAAAVVSVLSSKGLAVAVDTIGALGRVATQAGSAIGSVATYVTGSLTGGSVTAAVGGFRGILNGASDAFRSFRRGLRRGFSSQWAQDLKASADNVLATIRGLAPLAAPALTALGAVLSFVSSRAAAFTAWIRAVPEALTGLGPAIDSATDTAWRALIRFAFRAVEFGVRVRDGVAGTWLQLVGLVAEASPRLAGLLESARQTFIGLADGAIEAGLRITSGLANAVSGERLQSVLGAAGQILSGFVGTVRDFATGFLSQVGGGWSGVLAVTAAAVAVWFLLTGRFGFGLFSLAGTVVGNFGLLRSAVSAGLASVTAGMSFWGALAATVFGVQWRLIAAEISLAVATLARFGLTVARAMNTIAQKLGLVGGGASVAAGAGILALAIAVGQATGAFAALQAVLLLVVLGFSLTFYSVAIGTFAMKFFVDMTLAAVKAIQIFYAGSVIVLTALQVAFTTTFAVIRAAAALFWAFMALSPLTMIIGIALIVAAAALAAVAILKHFGVIKDGWQVITDAMTGAWSLALRAMEGAGLLFSDWYREGFLGGLLTVSGTIFRQIWADFLNIGIYAINKLFGFLGINKQFEYKGGAGDLQKSYDDKRKEVGLTDESGNETARRGPEPGMPAKPRLRPIYDPAPYASDNDIIQGGDGAQRPKVEEMQRLRQAEQDRFNRELQVYAEERRKVLERRKAEEQIRQAQEAERSNQQAQQPGALDGIRRRLQEYLPSIDGEGLSGIIKKLVPGGEGGDGLGGIFKRFLPDGMPGGDGTTPTPEGVDPASLFGGLFGGRRAPDADAARETALRQQFPLWSDDEISGEARRQKESAEAAAAEKAAKDKAAGITTTNAGGAFGSNLDRLMRGFSGLGGEGQVRRTDFATGVPQDISDGTGARGRPLDPTTGQPQAQGQQIVAANFTIRPGDKRLFGSREAIADFLRGLTDIGVDATADQARAT